MVWSLFYSINREKCFLLSAYRDRMFLQFESYLQSRTKPIPLEDIIPPTLASTGSQLTREEVISRQKSRPGVIRKPHHVTMATTEANRKRFVNP